MKKTFLNKILKIALLPMVSLFYGTASAEITTIDVLALYASNTASFSPVERIIAMEEYGNQALINSQSNIRIRVVHIEELNLPNAMADDNTLAQLRSNATALALRTKYGADLVTLITPTDQYCGYGYLSFGTNGQVSSFYKDYGFSVVGHSCTSSLIHEIGHNLGLNHSVKQNAEGGVYPWGRGYGVDGNFATEMAYGSSYSANRIQFFSNPDIASCNGLPCGVPIDQPNGAHSVLALAYAGPQIAQWFAPAAPPSSGNTAPSAGDDFASTLPGESLGIDVLGNDVDPDSDVLTVISTTQGKHGTTTTDGTQVTYTPVTDFSGEDTFTYTISDGNNHTASALVTITVAPPAPPPPSGNTFPTAVNDSVYTDLNQSVTIDVLSNDTDANGDTLSITSVDSGQFGSTTLSNGKVIYTPNNGAMGIDSFQYFISDGQGGTDTATVSVGVGNGLDFEYYEGQWDALPNFADLSPVKSSIAHDFSLFERDRDDEFAFRYHGLIEISQAGDYTFYIGSDDGSRLLIDGSVVTDNDGLHGYTETSGTIALTAGMHAFEVQFFEKWGGERLTVNWQGPGFGKMPVADSILFRGAATAPPVNQAPTAIDDAATTQQGQSVSIDVLANDSDPEGDTLTITSVNTPANGVVSNSGSSLLYTPSSSFTGSDSFSYSIDDGNGNTAAANVTVSVEATPPPSSDYNPPAELLVSQFYLEILHREPSNEEVNYWANKLNDGSMTSDEIADLFLSSPEFDSSIAPIVRLYFAYFLRIPDYNGLIYWINNYKSGMPVDTISDAFATSPEFTYRYGSQSNDAFITLLYNNVLGREPDQNGFDYWSNQLSSGSLSRGQVMLGFSNSEEFKAKAANQVYITMVYASLLGRSPSQEEFDNLMSAMTQGLAGQNLINQILASNEYASYRQANFTPPKELLNGFTWGALNAGSPVYNDRDYQFTDIPAKFTGIDYLLTSNGDRSIVSSSYISFQADRQVIVYVAYDHLNASVPSWMSDWTNTGLSLITNTTTLDVYSKTFPAGLITLGGNQEYLNYMYSVMIVPVNNSSGQTPPPNQAPSAANDSAATQQDQSVSIDVLANDSDPEGDTLTIAAVSNPANGTAAISASSVLYTPASGFSGSDSFSYTINDGNGHEATATVNITITATSPTPPPSGDILLTLSWSHSAPETLDGFKVYTGSTPDGATNEVADIAMTDLPVPASPSADFLSQTDLGLNTGDTVCFRTRAYNAIGLSGYSTAACTTIDTTSQGGVNLAPTAASDTAATSTEQAININVLANDSDPEGDTLTITAVSNPSNGAASNSGTSVQYTPASGFSGTDGFSYTISDGNGHEATGQVSITVASVNQAPTAANDNVSTMQDQAVSIDVLANDSDPEGDTLTITTISNPGNGIVSNSGSSLQYTPASNFSGLDSFSYTISDGNGHTVSANVSVTVEAAPTSPPPSSDFTPPAELLNGFTWGALNAGSPVYNDRDYQFTDIPAKFTGIDYLLTSNNDRSIVSSSYISFQADRQVIVYVAYDHFNASVPSWLSDWANTGLSLITNTTTLDVYSKTFPAGLITLGGNEEYYNYMYSVMIAPDTNSSSQLPPPNQAPSAANDSTATQQDQSVSIDVLANDSDPEGDTLTIAAVSNPANGTTAISGSSVLYTPASGFSGSDSFSYTINDGNGNEATANVDITITATSTTPPASGDLLVTVNWAYNNSPESVDGFKVYRSSTPTGAATEVSDIAVTDLTDPSAPSATYLSNTDLGLNSGDTVCFRTKAYNSVELSTFSGAVCAVIN